MLFRYPDISITVTPIGGDRFAVKHAGRLLVGSTATPFCTAARALLAEGFPPGSILAMRHVGEADYALRGKLSAVAKLTIKEGPNGPRAVRWKAPPSGSDRAPVRVFTPQVPYPLPVAPARIWRAAS